MSVAQWSDRTIRWGYYLLFALVPLLFTPWNYELFEFNKMMAVYAITVVVTGAWMVKSISEGELRIARTPLDTPIALFVMSQLVSSLFSLDPHVSWFGYYSRFNGGMFSVISYVLLYYGFVSNYKSYNDYKRYLLLSLSAGGIVALYGVAERLGIDKHLWVQDVQNRVFSTLGQPNWLAAYLVALLPLAMALAISLRSPRRFAPRDDVFHGIIWSLVAVLFFLVLLFTRSRSGLLGFAVADVLFWFVILIGHRLASQDVVLRAWRVFAVTHLFFALIVFFNGTHIDSIDRWVSYKALQQTRSVTVEATPSGTLLETGGTESGTIRTHVWQGAVNAWRSSLKTYLIGTGTETFAFAFYQHRPKGHNLTSEWDFLYNKAHNEYLNYLATTGILGLGSYLLFIGAFIYWFVKFHITSTKSQTNLTSQAPNWSLEFDAWCLRVALFAGWLSVLVTNFFGFSVVVVQLFLFLFPAMAIAAKQVKSQKQGKILTMYIPSRFFTPLVLLVSLVLLVLLVIGWYADTLYAAGYRLNRAGQYVLAKEKLSRALALNPVEPVFADELAGAYAELVTLAVKERDATRAAQYMKESVAVSDRALATSPNNVNFWKTRTKMFYAFSSFNPALNDAAIDALETGWRLSPNDPKVTYNLAVLYGRRGESDKAIDLLKTSIALKPNYRDAYYALWVFYTEGKKHDLAKRVLEEYLEAVDPHDKDFLERLNQ